MKKKIDATAIEKVEEEAAHVMFVAAEKHVSFIYSKQLTVFSVRFGFLKGILVSTRSIVEVRDWNCSANTLHFTFGQSLQWWSVSFRLGIRASTFLFNAKV